MLQNILFPKTQINNVLSSYYIQPDIIYHILHFLEVEDIISYMTVDKTHNNICSSNIVWKMLCTNDFANTKLFVTSYYETYKLCYF